MNQLFPTEYTADFEAAWKAWKATKNDAKSTAYASYVKSAKRRAALGLTPIRFLACIQAYNSWLNVENARRTKQRQAEHPKTHFSTWVNQARYENYMADADAALARAGDQKDRINSGYPGWEDEAKKLADELSLDRFAAWFDGVTVKRGEPVEIVFPKRFKASYVATNFPYQVRRAFGPCKLLAAGTRDVFDI